MPNDERVDAVRSDQGAVRPSRRGRPRRATRWRPGLEALEQHVLLSGANLVVSSAVAPTTLYASETARVGWSVANRGAEAADASWSDAVYLSKDSAFDASDTLLGSPPAAPTSLEPGESYTRTPSFSIPAADSGDYYLLFVADSGGDQAEADEADNVRAVPVTLSGSSGKLPDLVVTAATAPSSAEIGSINVSWTVKNQGSAARLRLLERLVLPVHGRRPTTPPIPSSRSSVPLQLPGRRGQLSRSTRRSTCRACRPATITCCSSPTVQHNVTESDETNNVRAVPITLTVPNVDLIVTAADAPATAKAGATVDVSWTVKNQGTDPATAGDWYDYVYLSTDDKYDALRYHT